MGSVFKKTVTRALPPGAEVAERTETTKVRLADGAETTVRVRVRLARWRDRKGRMRSATVTTGKDGFDRIRVESGTYFARYRDGNNHVVELPTGCRDKTAAQSVLVDLERKGERVRAGLLTSAESRTAEHLATPIGEHLAAYVTSLEASGATPKHVAESRRVIESVLEGCNFATLADLERSAMERWLNARRQSTASARTRNVDLIRLIAFDNWCVGNGRLTANPFKGVARADEKADPRRKRRSMTEGELARLLDVARDRPLLEALTVRRGKAKGQPVAKVRDEVRIALEVLGRERALIYKTLVLTGLRKSELASLTVAQLQLEGPMPHVELDVREEKNREGNAVVLRADLAKDLEQWLKGKLAALQSEARQRGEPIPTKLPADTLIFSVPSGLIRIFDRDLRMAGISKRDERGRTLDVHALRTTFGTLLSRGGVPLRTAQAAMRHADPSMTANVYTDPKLLDVCGALDVLPTLPLDGGATATTKRMQAIATATCDERAVALLVAQTADKRGATVGTADKMNTGQPELTIVDAFVVSAEIDKPSATLTSDDNVRSKWAMRDSNPRLPACKAGALTN
jgi:integrase